MQEILAGSVGLGDYADFYYTVSVQIGTTTTALDLADTGSSDLWVISEACHTKTCRSSTSPAYSTSLFDPLGPSMNISYGDSKTSTYAAGPVGLDTVSVAGISMSEQPFAAINRTNNAAVSNGAAGLLGLGFPSERYIAARIFNSPATTDTLISNIGKYGPFVSRLVMSGVIDQPMFAITLQRDTVDVSGHGAITIGQLPTGVDNSSITWVPVRLYAPRDGGIKPPTFAVHEVYPLRWEAPLDGVFLDGVQLPASAVQPDGVSSSSTSALIDTGNSLIRGPSDVVTNILSTVSPAYASNLHSKATFPCTTPHTLAFKIGGNMFSVDPRDFVAQNKSGDAKMCVASRVVSTDPPRYGSLFSWSLGVPFLKSNLVVFYYGNLTHPSVDPPRIGFVSRVPGNAPTLLEEAVDRAQQHSGIFSSTREAAPTATTVITVATSTADQTPLFLHRKTALSSSASSTRQSMFRGFWSAVVPTVSFISYHNLRT
ncbi:acid protease [Sparassis latifolia]